MTTKAWDESGRTVHDPTPRDVDTMVAGLEAGNEFLIVERADDHYVQVLWRHREGRYQLEYRDGGPTEHHRTYTESPEEVATAMSGWLTGAPAWREPFTWEDISHYFTGDGS